MALEVRQNLDFEPIGVESSEEALESGVHVSRIRVINKRGERELGKPMGTYVTLDMGNIAQMTLPQRDELARQIAHELQTMIGDAPVEDILVVGLGNRMVTPDALGPRVCDHVFVTRHIKTHIPEAIDERASSVSTLAPGVLGVTGLETTEVVCGVVEHTNPGLIIAIDALASRSTERIGASVQLSDTGVSPGSGIGNRRRSLDQQTLGVKVIAIGVPTVTYAATIVGDLLSAASNDPDVRLHREKLMANVLSQKGSELIVTPKEIDMLVSHSARLLGNALNLALNPYISTEEIEEYMN